jgi:hypothetical protein
LLLAHLVVAVLADWGVCCRCQVPQLLVGQQQRQGYQELFLRHLVLLLLE